MTGIEDSAKTKAIKALLERDEDFVRSAVQSLVQAALEAEMTEALPPRRATARRRAARSQRLLQPGAKETDYNRNIFVVAAFGRVRFLVFCLDPENPI